jgi:predicted phage baseplate assembly protein
MSLPIPKLDDKQFSELVEEAKAQIPVHAREWTDHNVHDPGITFIELFAWLVEMQIYRLDQVTEKNKLKFLKLLGIQPRHATAASTDATFSFSDSSEESVFLPKGTSVAAEGTQDGKSVIFETVREIYIIPVTLERIVTQSWQEVKDTTDANEFDGHFYHAFGELAEEESMLYLGFDQPFPEKEEIDLMVYLYGDDLGPVGVHGEEEPEVIPSAEVRWEYLKKKKNEHEWADLKIVTDETMAFTYGGMISFAAPEEMAEWEMPQFEEESERYWIRCRVVKPGYEIPPRINAIQLNTVPVTEGETVEEKLSCAGQPDQTHYLWHIPVLAGTLTISILDLDNTWKDWVEVDDFDATGPKDPCYVVNYDSGMVLFGDGIHGLIPPEGADNIKAAYRSGGGEAGNVKAGAIDLIPDDSFAMLAMRNDQAASGGSEEETLEEAIFRARKDLKERYRAVTSDDYEYIAKKTPGLRVKRAKSIPYKNDGSVTVVVVPESISDGLVEVSEGFRTTVCNHLDMHRLITTSIHVRGPEYVKVSVNATVKTMRGYDSDTVRQGIENALKQFLHPTNGGADGEGWQFGRSVFKSEIYGLIDGIDGVDCVYELDMSAGGGYVHDGEKIKIPPEGLVHIGDCSIKIEGTDEECIVKEGLS